MLSMVSEIRQYKSPTFIILINNSKLFPIPGLNNIDIGPSQHRRPWVQIDRQIISFQCKIPSGLDVRNVQSVTDRL